jgi:hypothetical protein
MRARANSPIHDTLAPDVKVTVTLPPVSQRHLRRIIADMEQGLQDATPVTTSRAIRAALAALAGAIALQHQQQETDNAE